MKHRWLRTLLLFTLMGMLAIPPVGAFLVQPAAAAGTPSPAAPTAPGPASSTTAAPASSTTPAPAALAAVVPSGQTQIEAARIQAQLAFAGSVIVMLVTVSVSLFNDFHRRKSERSLRELQITAERSLADLRIAADQQSAAFTAAADEKLAAIKAQYESRLSVESARREYEYEALKRLYTVCEPLLFQLQMSSRVAIGRIIALARAARVGDLPQAGGLLDDPAAPDDYFFRSTIHQILAPLAASFMLQTQLISVDLMIDPYLRRQFYLSENLYKSLIRPMYFAAQPPVILLDRAQDPQGVHLGHLERAAGALCTSTNGALAVMTFGEFEQQLSGGSASMLRDVAPIIALFRHFHPHRKPVLWRILVAQYYVLRALRLSVRVKIKPGSVDPTPTILTLDVAKETELLFDSAPTPDELREHEAALTMGHRYMLRALGL